MSYNPAVFNPTGGAKLLASASMKTAMINPVATVMDVNPLGNPILPANYFTPGKIIRGTIAGRLTTNTNGTHNFFARMKLGSVVITGPSVDTGISNIADITFNYTCNLICVTAGVTGQIAATSMINTSFYSGGVVVKGGGNTLHNNIIDTTVPITMDLLMQCETTDSIGAYMSFIEALN